MIVTISMMDFGQLIPGIIFLLISGAIFSKTREIKRIILALVSAIIGIALVLGSFGIRI